MRLLPALFCLSALSALAPDRLLAGPDWWSAQGTSIWKTTPVDSENYAPVTVGQLKHVAAMARLYLQGALATVGGEGPAIAAMVDAFTTADPENAAPANVGQLKNVAKVFYDRLAQMGYAWQTGTFSPTTATTPYPWTGTVHPDNAMPCNIGQLKNVFSFALTPAFLGEDGDGDGLPSWWEMAWQFDPLLSDSNLDADLDQLSNLEEYQLTTWTGFTYNPRLASTAGTGWSDYEHSLMTGGQTEQETAAQRGSDPHVLRTPPLYGAYTRGVELWGAQYLIATAPGNPPFVPIVGNAKQWLGGPGNESSFNDVPNVAGGVFENRAAYQPEWPDDLLTSGVVGFYSGFPALWLTANGGTTRVTNEQAYTHDNVSGDITSGQIWLKVPQRVNFPVSRTVHSLKKTRYFYTSVTPVALPSAPADELFTHTLTVEGATPPAPGGAPPADGISEGWEIAPFPGAVSLDFVKHVSRATLFRFVFSAYPPEALDKVGGAPVTTETENIVYLPVRLNENKEQDTAAISQNLPGAPAQASALPDIDRNRASVSDTGFLSSETKGFDHDFITLSMDAASLPQEEIKLELDVAVSGGTKVYLYDDGGRAVPPEDLQSTEAHPIAPIWEKLVSGQIRAEVGRLNTAAAEVPGSPPLPAPGPATLTVRATFLNPQAETAPGAPPPSIVLNKSIVLLPVEINHVNRDVGSKLWSNNKRLHSNDNVYSGDFQGDMIEWRIPNLVNENNDFSWFAEDQDGIRITGPSGSGVNFWQISNDALSNDPAEHKWLKWNPGKWKIICSIGDQDYTIDEFKIGWRTRTMLVIGQIVPTNTHNPDKPMGPALSAWAEALADDFTYGLGLGGIGTADMAFFDAAKQGFRQVPTKATEAWMGYWSTGLPTLMPPFIPYVAPPVPPASVGPFTASLSTTPRGALGSVTARQRYWMIQHLLNVNDDEVSFASDLKYPQQMTVQQYAMARIEKQYRIFHLFRAKFFLDGAGKLDPSTIDLFHHDALNGPTKLKIDLQEGELGALPIPPNVLSPFPGSTINIPPFDLVATLNSEPSEASPHNETLNVDSDHSRFSSYASARIGYKGQRGSYRLFGKDAPWIFSEIIFEVGDDRAIGVRVGTSVTTEWRETDINSLPDQGGVVGRARLAPTSTPGLCQFNNLNIYDERPSVEDDPASDYIFSRRGILEMEGHIELFVESASGSWPEPPTTPSVH